MDPENLRDHDGRDWNVKLFDLVDSKSRPAITAAAWWRISKRLKPYVVAKIALNGKDYKIVLYPTSEDSFPAVKLFERVLRREAQLMAAALGGPGLDPEEEQEQGSPDPTRQS